MRIFSLTIVFRVMVAAALQPLGSLNRLSLHVMGLSPNNRAQSARTLSSGPAGDKFASHSLNSQAKREKEVCASHADDSNSHFPSLATVFDCRGGHSMHPMEEHASALKATVPVRLFGVELSLFGLKLLLQLGLTMLNVACWYIPMRTKSFSQNENLMALANTFSAGIFLMLAFTHLIPHALHTLEAADINPMYAFHAAVVGYLAIFAIEKLFFDSHSLIQEVMDESTPIRRPSVVGSSSSSSSEYSGQDKDNDTPRARSVSVVSQQSAVVLLLAMAVHSLFETVALGMAPDRTSAVILATSVALHQPAESLALLVAFLKTSMERKIIVRWLGLFSIIGPLGVFLGRFIQALASPLVEGLLVAMTAGTFLYVGTTEIIPESFDDEVPYGEKWKRFGALVGGIGSIMLLGDEDHSHGGE